MPLTPKFLVIGRSAKPIPAGANLRGALEQLKQLREKGKARGWALGGLEGWVAIFDVESHDELNDYLYKNPLGRWGEYEVFPLGTMQAEYKTLTDVGVVRTKKLEKEYAVSK